MLNFVFMNQLKGNSVANTTRYNPQLFDSRRHYDSPISKNELSMAVANTALGFGPLFPFH